MRNWDSAMEAWYLYLPRYPGFKPRTVPMSPATPHASPAMAPSGPMGGLQWRSLTKQSCIQLAQEKGLILLSKLFISSSRSRQFPAPWTRIRGFFIVKAWSSIVKQFLSMCPAPHACAPCDCGICCPAYWFGILSGCEQKVRAELHTLTPSTSWLLRLCPGYWNKQAMSSSSLLNPRMEGGDTGWRGAANIPAVWTIKTIWQHIWYFVTLFQPNSQGL